MRVGVGPVCYLCVTCSIAEGGTPHGRGVDLMVLHERTDRTGSPPRAWGGPVQVLVDVGDAVVVAVGGLCFLEPAVDAIAQT
ncbi:hypothetical protein ThrDRAFT_03382 [Frankia casuarinae]|nr:hypothetical protein CcI6DRAFT_04393 [Frankia sp. CcI6]EYT90978.1 hypothetical protein ThrDRAFT_03382 [Frankia casuarinae]KDA41553.1 hypothetical protein BMG523Draft_03621 [Frankia sp. BMG5.23]OAA18893.1 hypothetical protein AAY23_111416 [Frankia casuarinae]